MYVILSVISVLLIGELAAQNNDTKSSIGFPEIEENESIKNKDNRQPVYLPAKCAPNELYYPGDQTDDWICDCRPAYLYYPGSDSCWPAYRRGPCAFGDYLILPKDSVIPVCLKSPCEDNYVSFNGVCQRLGSITACTHLFPKVAAVGVNATDLEVGCVMLNLESRFGDNQLTVEQRLLYCGPGSKSSVKGKCDITTIH